MHSVITTKTYSPPPVCEKEVLRYADFKGEDPELSKLLKQCIIEAADCFSYKVCSIVLPLSIDLNVCNFELFSVSSQKLASNLSGCKEAVVFAATLGVGIDRLISKYSSISPVKALMFQALGAERIEALCDCFCEDISKEHGLLSKARFSPGYGDLPLEAQTKLFSVLDCQRKIGLTLNSSLLMSPSKSVTAIMGLYKGS